jgi:flavin-dependent dehydrogenase
MMEEKSGMKQVNRYDAAIIGASPAGTTAAVLFTRHGLRVALIERQQELDAYKKVGTHYIQADAMPVMRRLVDIWTFPPLTAIVGAAWTLLIHRESESSQKRTGATAAV